MVFFISAIGKNGEYAKNGKLPWPKYEEYAKQDMLFFKNYTLGKEIIMGYNTWLSLGEKPLINRINIVITKKNISNITCYKNLEDALINWPNAIIIGGAKLLETLILQYKQYINGGVINQFYNSFDNCDTFFDISIANKNFEHNMIMGDYFICHKYS